MFHQYFGVYRSIWQLSLLHLRATAENLEEPYGTSAAIFALYFDNFLKFASKGFKKTNNISKNDCKVRCNK